MTSTAFGNELQRHSFDKWKAGGVILRRGLKLTKEGKSFIKFRVNTDAGPENPFAEPGSA